MKNFLCKLLVKLKLRFRSSEIERDYCSSLQRFAYINFLIYFLILVAFQAFIMGLQVTQGKLAPSICIGLSLLVSLFLLIFRKKCLPCFESLSLILITIAYVLSILYIHDYSEQAAMEALPTQSFFQGYWLCLFQQISLRYLTNFSFIFLFDIGALLLRSSIFAPSINDNPTAFIVHLLLDLLMLHACYRKEIVNREIFLSQQTQKSDSDKFKSLVVHTLPEKLLITDPAMDRELFSNNAFQQAFRSNGQEHDFKQDLRKIYIMHELMEASEALPASLEKFLGENSVVTLWDFQQQALKHKLFNEQVFKIYGSLTPPTVHKSTVQRRIFEIKIFCFRWDTEDALALTLNEMNNREPMMPSKFSDLSNDKAIASVSHELRTPLNGIQGMIQIMQKQAEKAKDFHMQQSLAICKSNADLLLHIINSIIDLQYLAKNKLVLHKTKVNVRDLIHQIGSLFIFQCEHKRLDLILSIDESDRPDEIITDKDRLTQVLVHLASNAVKFTYKGGITIGAKKDERNSDSIVFWVEDTGTGIKEEEKSSLFKMCRQSDTVSVGTQGIGLGLTISKELVMRLKATKNEDVFDVESEENKGSRFSFSLPLDLNRAEEKANEEDFGDIGQEYELEDRRYSIRNKRYSKMSNKPEEEKLETSKRDFSQIMKKIGRGREEDLEDVGDELYVEKNLSDFLFPRTPSLIQDKITQYVTRPKYNTYKLIENQSSGKFTYDESPTIKSLIRITSPGLQMEGNHQNNNNRSKSQSYLAKEDKRPDKDSNNLEEKGDFSDFSNVPLKVNESQRKKAVETYTHNLENSHILNRDVQSATSIISTPRVMPNRKKSRVHPARKPILLVDDNSFNLLITSHIIEDSGFQVVTAISGVEAIHQVKNSYRVEGNKPFMLILMDLQMPIMDGFETTKILIEMMDKNEIPRIPIVALTAQTTEQDVAKCLEYGMVSHLAKPLLKEDLLRVFTEIDEE